MIVLKENVDNLNADLIVKINREDYAPKVKASLEKYRKTAKIPGFRPGNVPMGMIEKQYGKSLLAEELNKLANDGIYNFIKENTNFSETMLAEAKEYGSFVVDTNDKSPDLVAKEILEILQ